MIFKRLMVFDEHYEDIRNRTFRYRLYFKSPKIEIEQLKQLYPNNISIGPEKSPKTHQLYILIQKLKLSTSQKPQRDNCILPIVWLTLTLAL